MSFCDYTLLCNFPKCQSRVSGFAWVTVCSHIFCDQHGSNAFSRSPAICPACTSPLSGMLDMVRMELSPCEQYKAMVLAGLPPDVILDISARALAFWSYQVHQEHIHQEYRLSRADTQLKQMAKALTQQNQSIELELTGMKREVASQKKAMEKYQTQYSDVSEKLMEKNMQYQNLQGQYQNLQGLYDSLRRPNMVVDVGEGDTLLQPGHHAGVVRPATPQRSPQFLSVGQDGDSRTSSCLEADEAKTFQFSSPSRERGRPVKKKH
ncbi:hypothetical protein VZT92_017182 [Zoarces viviparus]|uniref:Cyclin B1 interacting protein 1 n=1 Tax=Zoarces viviparus TaxID=48416 RepID=A0AAW1EQZ0_ZOAVI